MVIFKSVSGGIRIKNLSYNKFLCNSASGVIICYMVEVWGNMCLAKFRHISAHFGPKNPQKPWNCKFENTRRTHLSIGFEYRTSTSEYRAVRCSLQYYRGPWYSRGWCKKNWTNIFLHSAVFLILMIMLFCVYILKVDTLTIPKW